MDLDHDIETLFTTVPLLACAPRAGWRISPLGGITNRSYRLQANGQDLVLRWPGTSASRYLNRNAEGDNAAAVAALGLAPAVLAGDPQVGWYITQFETDAQALTSTDFADAAVMADVVAHLGKLHQSHLQFPARQNLFGAIDHYISLAPTALMIGLRRQLDQVSAALSRNPCRHVACHIDPNPANFLRRADGSLSLIDWEFAAMEEPLWDLATVALESPLDAAAIHGIMTPMVAPEQWPRFELYQTALLLVAASWCEMELAAGNPSAELAGLRDERVQRLEARLADPRFPGWLGGA